MKGQKISVLGLGRWGTTLAWYFNLQGEKVILWGRDRTKVNELKAFRTNEYVYLPPKIEITSDLRKAIQKSRYIFIAILSQGMRDLCLRLKRFGFSQKTVISAVKGIEQDTLLRMSEVILDTLGKVKLAVLAGPGHVENIIDQKKTLLVLAAKNGKMRNSLSGLISSEIIRICPSADLAGVELSGAFKNVVGIAAGICDGLEEEDLKAGLITYSLAEITKLGISLGANPETFKGLSFLGDICVTCFGPHSRNRKLGELIAQGKKLEEIPFVAEGVATAKAMYQLALREKIAMPLTEQIYQVLFQNRSPQEAINELWKLS